MEKTTPRPFGGTEILRLSDSISRPLEKLFKVGGLGLVFIFVGFLAMLVGYSYKTELSRWLFGVGASIVFSCLCLFLFAQIAGPIKAGRLLRENKQLIDSVQEMGIRLTESLGDVQSLMFKHYEHVGRLLEIASPVLSELPLFADTDFSNTHNVNKIIVEATQKSQAVIGDLRDALITCNISNLRKYTEDLKRIQASIKDALKKESAITNKLKAYKDNVLGFRHEAIDYLETLNSINATTIDNIRLINTSLSLIIKLPVIGRTLDANGISQSLRFSQTLLNTLSQIQSANKNLISSLSTGEIESARLCLHNLKSIADILRNSQRFGSSAPLLNE